jgi:hypothetical protein
MDVGEIIWAVAHGLHVAGWAVVALTAISTATALAIAVIGAATLIARRWRGFINELRLCRLAHEELGELRDAKRPPP